MHKILPLLSTLIVCSIGANEIKAIDLDINSKEGYRVYLENKLHNESILKDKINQQKINNLKKKLHKQECDLNLVRKSVVKIIKNTKLNKRSSANTTSSNSCKKNCIIKKIPVDIEKSYFKYKTPKTFKVTKRANVYKYPLIGIPKIKKLNVGTKFKADMYTKAGWVHYKNEGWVKGYRIYPSLKNNTTKDDIKKRGKTKFILKKICKEK